MTTPWWHAPSRERAARLFRGMRAANETRQREAIKASAGRPHKHATSSSARSLQPCKSPAHKSLSAGPPPGGCQGPRQSHKAADSEALSTQNLSNP